MMRRALALAVSRALRWWRSGRILRQSVVVTVLLLALSLALILAAPRLGNNRQLFGYRLLDIAMLAPMCFAVVLVVYHTAIALRVLRMLRGADRRGVDLCPQCHYDLATDATRCPECGVSGTSAERDKYWRWFLRPWGYG